MLPFIAAMILLDETPQKTVQAFVEAINAQDASAAGRRVVGGKPGFFPFRDLSLKISAIVGETKIEQNEARVEADVTVSGTINDKKTSHETIILQKMGGDWQIVPVNPERVGMHETQYVSMLAYMVSHREVFLQAKAAAKKTMCLSNVKQIGLATMMYAMDHNESLPKDPTRFKTVVMPYLKNPKVFLCPEDASGGPSYFLDSRVAGKRLAFIRLPSETAMIIEGTAKKTAFRHKGMAAVAFVDGHAKMVRPQQMMAARTVSLK